MLIQIGLIATTLLSALVGLEWPDPLAHEARDLLSDDTGFVIGPLSAGTRAMLERIGALATEEAFEADQAAMRIYRSFES